MFAAHNELAAVEPQYGDADPGFHIMDEEVADDGEPHGDGDLSARGRCVGTTTEAADNATDDHISSSWQVALLNQGFVVEECHSDCSEPTG